MQTKRAMDRQRLTGELDVIRLIRHTAGTAPHSVRRGLVLGIGDDCAILRPKPGEDLVVTTDFSLEGRHFRRDWHSAASIGHRILARGLSDIAAMGARPLAAFLSLALPRSLAADPAWLRAMLRGFATLATQTGTPLAGGDTAEAPADELLADIVLLGAVPHNRALRRDGARPGDRLFVTGALGGAGAQLATLLESSPSRPKKRGRGIQPHFFPEPRLAAGQALLRRSLASAALDLSDGLSTDLHHLCQASGVGAQVDSAHLPLSPLLARKPAGHALHLALHGGEDYELLFSVPPQKRIGSSIGGVPVTEIGRIVRRPAAGPVVMLLGPKGERSSLEPAGWEHLR